jgi:hypothetical protein
MIDEMPKDIVKELHIRAAIEQISGTLFEQAADEIERLRKELGQVSNADSWVSETDAAYLDNLLNWCEFNAMDWHRALQRLVNDRARLRNALRLEQEELAACCIDRKETQRERDEARREVCHLVAELAMINHTSVTVESIAEEYGWDCFKNV